MTATFARGGHARCLSRTKLLGWRIWLHYELLVRPRLVAGTAFGLLFTSTISVAQAEVPWPELVMLHLPCTMACLPTVMLRPTYQMMGLLQQCRDTSVTEDVWVEGARLGPRAAQASTSAQFHEDSGVRRLLRRRE